MLRLIAAKYGLATHLALLVSVPVALTPFLTASVWIRVTLWLCAFALLWMVGAPSIRALETEDVARRRTWRALAADPVAWIFAAAAAYAAVRAFNDGVVLAYDAESSLWRVAEPAFGSLPASTPGAGGAAAAAAAALLLVVAGMRNALGASARTWFALVAGVVTGAGGWAAAACALLGLGRCASLAGVGLTDVSFVGSAFTAWLFIVVAAGVQAEEMRWGLSSLPFAFAVGGNAVATLVFLPPPLAAWALSAAGLFALLLVVRLRVAGVRRRTAVRAAAMLLVGAAAAAAFWLTPWGAEVKARKVGWFEPSAAFTPERADLAETLDRLAGEMWRERPWRGVGEGAFGLKLPFFATETDWTALPAKPTAALNGYRTLLAERGLVGASVLGGAFAALAAAWALGLAGAVRRAVQDGERGLVAAASVCAPLPLAGALAAVCAVVALAFSSPLRIAVFPLSALSAFALAGASFSRPRNRTEG